MRRLIALLVPALLLSASCTHRPKFDREASAVWIQSKRYVHAVLAASVARGANPPKLTATDLATPSIPYWRYSGARNERLEFLNPRDFEVRFLRWNGKTPVFEVVIRGRYDEVDAKAPTAEQRSIAAEIQLIQRNPSKLSELERLRGALLRARDAVTSKADGRLPLESTTEALLSYNKRLGNAGQLAYDDIAALKEAGARIPKWLAGRSGYEAKAANLVLETPNSELVRGISPSGFLVGREGSTRE